MRLRVSCSSWPVGGGRLFASLAFLGLALHPPLLHAEERAATAGPSALAAASPVSREASPPARPKRLLVLDPVANHVDKETVQIVSGLLTVELASLGGVEVISGADVQRMLALESQKVDLGCSAESCVSEIADAMGTDLVVFGNIGRLGELYILTLNLFETAAAKSHGRVSMRTRTIEELPEKLADELPNLMASVRPLPAAPAAPVEATLRAPPAVPAGPAASRRPELGSGGRGASQLGDEGSRTAMMAAGVVFSLGGLAGVGVGLVPWAQHEQAVQQANAVKQTDWAAYQEAQEAAADARDAYQTLGLPALGAGGAALALGTLLWVGAALLAPGEAAE